MTFVARSVRYVLRKRVRTIVLLIILTIITASTRCLFRSATPLLVL